MVTDGADDSPQVFRGKSLTVAPNTLPGEEFEDEKINKLIKKVRGQIK